MITARATRLHRAVDLDGFRRAIATLVAAAQPLEVRDTFVVVPTRAAADELRRTLEHLMLAPGGAAACLPDIGTRADLLDAFRARLIDAPPRLTAFDREVLLARAAREARAAGLEPPFAVRPGLVAEMVALYDALIRQRRTVDRFEEFLTDELSHSDDRGATRLLAQTAFLVDAFRRYEAHVASSHADDEHGLRERLLAEPAPRPLRQVIVTITDRVADPAGLWSADIDLLTRVPGLDRIDVVATEARLSGGWLERLFEELPGIEECVVPPGTAGRPVCLVPSRRMPGCSPVATAKRSWQGSLADSKRNGAPAGSRRTREWRSSSVVRCRISTWRATCLAAREFPMRHATPCRWPPSRSRRHST